MMSTEHPAVTSQPGPASVNEPTVDQINASIALLQTGTYNFSPEQLAEVDQALYNINPELPALYTNAGIITDPNYLAYVSDPTTTTPLVGEYGGYNYWLEGTDFLKVLEAAGSNPVDPTLSADLQTLFTNFTFPGDPAALAALFGESAAARNGCGVNVIPGGVCDTRSFSANGQRCSVRSAPTEATVLPSGETATPSTAFG